MPHPDAGPWGSPVPGGPYPLADDTAALSPIGLRHLADKADAPGNMSEPRRARGKGAASHRRAGKTRSARAAGLVAVMAAVVGAAVLTGTQQETRATAQRVEPEPTSVPVPATDPTTAPTSGGPPTPDAERTETAAADPRAGAKPPSARPGTTAPSPVATPEQGSGTRCVTPHLPGATCPPTSRPETPPPTRRPISLCCDASGPEVAELQYRLRELGLYEGRVNGAYNQRVTDAVASYQRSRRINGDPRGSYGPATRAALQREVPDVGVR
ncbi:peptidoglycan-binding protein [Streptomyces sp. NC-S4]